MTVTKLDRNKKYGAEDADEIFWKFEYCKVGDITGWWTYRKRPEDNVFFCIGNKTEAEIRKFLNTHDHPLTEDDLIDLELYMEATWGKDLPKEE